MFAAVTPVPPATPVAPPVHAMMSWMSARVLSSGAAPGEITASPRNGLPAKIAAVFPASPVVIVAASDLPRLARMRFADASTAAPSGRESSSAASGRPSTPCRSTPASRNRAADHLMAATTSGTRIRPSPSPSISARVFSSISRPWTGQLRATQSFWSRFSRLSRSAPDSSMTWSSPPMRKNFQVCEVADMVGRVDAGTGDLRRLRSRARSRRRENEGSQSGRPGGGHPVTSSSGRDG